MTRDEIIEQAIGELKTAENSCADSYAHGNILRAIELLESAKAEPDPTKGCWEDDPEIAAIIHSEPAVPPAGEFAELLRSSIYVFEQIWIELPVDNPQINLMKQILSGSKQACDRLDAQQQEIERLRTALEYERPFAKCYRRVCETFQLEGGILDYVARLTAENKCLKDKLEDWENREGAICPEDVGFEEYIKAQAERIEKLKKYIQHKESCSRNENGPRSFCTCGLEQALQQQDVLESE